jgi:hypothetical protein
LPLNLYWIPWNFALGWTNLVMMAMQ